MECEGKHLAPHRGRLHRPLVATALKPLLIFSARGTRPEGGNRGVQKCDSVDPLSLVIKCLGGGVARVGGLDSRYVDTRPFPPGDQVNTHTTSHPESSLAYSPPTMAAKRLNRPTVLSTVASFPLSNAPLPTPAGWWRPPSSSLSSLARDDDDGSDVHHCSCCRVVVVLIVRLVVVLLLSVVPSGRCCHRRTTNAQWPLPSPHDHLHCRCRRNRIRCSYHRRPHLAAAFTAVVDAVIAPPPHRGHKFPQRSYCWLSLAIAGYRHFRGHRRRHCCRRCIRCSHRCCHRCHHRRSLRNNPIFWRAAKNTGNSKITNHTKLPISK